MGWKGIALGGYLGSLFGGPLGALLGAALGHQVEKHLSGDGRRPEDKRQSPRRAVHVVIKRINALNTELFCLKIAQKKHSRSAQKNETYQYSQFPRCNLHYNITFCRLFCALPVS